MPIKFLRVYVFILSIILFTSKSFSEPPKNKVELSLTPLACFVKQAGDVCNITVKVKWKSQTPINACLYQQSEKVDCWIAKSSANSKVSVSLSDNMKFSLQGDNDDVYAEQHITIAKSISQKYRRRLRADWSLF